MCVIIAVAAAICLLAWPAIDSHTDRPSLSAAASPDESRVAVTLIAGGQQQDLRTEPVTVAELLASAGIALGELDRVEVEPAVPDGTALDHVVADGDAVRVVRVAREVVERVIEVAAETRVRYDRRVHRSITVREGSPGRARAQVEVWTCDGEETQRSVLSQRMVKRMTPEVVVRGDMSLPSRGGEVLYMEATGYDPGPRSCGRYASGRTAIGLLAGRGVVAVDPRVIPLGTKLYVDGYGECVAGDVGSAIKGRHIDLGFDSYREAMAWGRRPVRVRILE